MPKPVESPTAVSAPDRKPRLVIHARQSKLIGLWAARKMGLLPLEADMYARSIVRADIEKRTSEDVVRKITADLGEYGIVISDEEVHQQMEELFSTQTSG